MANEQKITKVTEFTEVINGKSLIFFNYQGISVKDLTNIRLKLREEGGFIKIIKNNLLKIALKNNNIEPEASMIKGMFAVAIVDDDHFTSSGKVLLEAEKGDKVKIEGGYYSGDIVDNEYVKKLASIPAKDILYSMLVGSLQGPIADLVFTLQGIADKKEENEEK